MRPQIVKILTLVLVLVNSTVMLAQQAGPPPPENGERGPQLPIDDNVFLLLGIGLLYGAYIAYKKYKATNTPG